MASLAAIRNSRRQERLSALRQGAAATAAGWRNAEIWLFGSLARGDWDAYSDVDLLAIAPTQVAADALALSQERWQQLKQGDDPYWRAIGRDALRLDQP